MGFFDFLKIITNKNSITKIKTEKVAFEEIGNLVETKRKEIEDREKEIFVLIKNKISMVIKELNEKVRIIEGIDIESKKVEDKIKLIVRGNLNNYINCVKNFIGNISNLKEENLEKFIDRINKIFLDFNKKSYMSYQKSTFLIGKEIAALKESIINLFRYLEDIINKNKDIIDSSKIIYVIKLKLKQINETNEILGMVDEKVRSLNEKIRDSDGRNQEVLDGIEKIKKSKAYVENLKKQEEIKSAEEELEKEICRLKEMINFKALGNIFHTDKEKMDMIKVYREDLQASIQKDDGTGILSLLDESKLNKGIISAKIKQINDKKDEIIRKAETIKKDETEELLSETIKIKLKIENLNNEKIKELKRHQGLETKRKEIIDSIKQALAKINVEIKS